MPDLTVISGASEQELKQQESTRVLKAALIGLTANLIRMVRGAGAPDRLLEQVRIFAEAYAAFVDVHGREAHPSLFNRLLLFGNPELPENDDYAEILLSDYAICRSALQVVASSLLEQQRQRDSALSNLRLRLTMREDAAKRRKGRSRRK